MYSPKTSPKLSNCWAGIAQIGNCSRFVVRNAGTYGTEGDGYTILKRGRSVGSAASNAFHRTIRAPCDSKNARSSGVKNEEPSVRRLNSRRSRPLGLRNLV